MRISAAMPLSLARDQTYPGLPFAHVRRLYVVLCPRSIGMLSAGDLGGGEAQAHPRAAAALRHLRRVEQLELAAVLLENLSDDGEPEAGPLLAGGDVGLEQPVAILLGQAGSVVDHVDDDVAAVAPRPPP